MKKAVFQKLKEIEKEKEMDELDEGEFFLYGKNVIAQKQNKKEGQQISYYKIIAKNGESGVTYTPVYDTLEKN
jgi:hypothetical protein